MGFGAAPRKNKEGIGVTGETENRTEGLDSLEGIVENIIYQSGYMEMWQNSKRLKLKQKSKILWNLSV